MIPATCIERDMHVYLFVTKGSESIREGEETALFYYWYP